MDRYLVALVAVAVATPTAELPETVSEWSGVRCVIRHEVRYEQLYEERVTIWHTSDLDAARQRAAAVGAEYTGMAQGYLLAVPVRDAAAAFSLMRVSDLGPGAYLDRYFDPGSERQRDAR